MNESSDNNIDKTLENNNLERKFLKIESGGLNYIKNEKNYLILSAVVPIYMIIVQCINLGYVFTAPPIDPSDPRPPINPFNVFTPSIILFIISFFALINFIYLMSWREKIKIYEGKALKKQKSLTSLFYDIVKSMKTIRIIFIIVNINSLYYFIWFILWTLSIMEPHHPPPPLHINILNGLSIVGLLIYLIIQWKHFIQWNRKLRKLRFFEKQIFNEICELNRKRF